MARKKVLDLNADSTIEWAKVGQQLNGYYLGFKTVTTDFGPSKLHVLVTDAGTVGCWGSAQLDSKLGTVAKGTATFITFGGKTKIAGGKTMKNFDVEYDDDDKMEVSSTVVNFSNDSTESDDDNTAADDDTQDIDQDAPAGEEDDNDTEINAAAEPAPKKGLPAGPTPEQKSKANAMLAKLQAKKPRAA
jgi:hypothetical protein